MLGYIESGHANIGQECEVRLLDKLLPAKIIAESPYDPENIALKA